MSWTTTKRSWAAESICSFVRLTQSLEGRLQTGASRLSPGDHCYVDVQFGRCTFQQRSEVPKGADDAGGRSTFWLHSPNGATYDLRAQGTRPGTFGHAAGADSCGPEMENHVAAHFAPHHNGTYILDARRQIGSPVTPGRSVRCAKTIVGVSTGGVENLGLTGYDRPVSQVLEIVPLNDPTGLHVGDTLTVRVLFKGTALPGAFLTVIPRGKVLPRLGVENPYDLVTDSQGKANFTFHEPNYHLLVVHLETEEPGGASNGAPQMTEYAGDLTVMVKPKV